MPGFSTNLSRAFLFDWQDGLGSTAGTSFFNSSLAFLLKIFATVLLFAFVSLQLFAASETFSDEMMQIVAHCFPVNPCLRSCAVMWSCPFVYGSPSPFANEILAEFNCELHPLARNPLDGLAREDARQVGQVNTFARERLNESSPKCGRKSSTVSAAWLVNPAMKASAAPRNG